MRIDERPAPAVTGSPDITQGAYGDHGNLELVAPDPVEGFWVLWCNLDHVEHHAGAPVGRWSPGLLVPTGTRVAAVRIAQVAAGPRWLECAVVTADGALERWHWSPAAGFEPAGRLAAGVADAGALHQGADGRFVVTVVPRAGAPYRLVGDDARYPEVAFRVEPGAGEWHPSPPGTASCRSTRGVERVAVRGGVLLHALDAEPRPVRPAVWVDD